MNETTDEAGVWKVYDGGGEFDGWLYWPGDPFEDMIGPFFARQTEDGGTKAAFRVEARHLNGGGSLHGGCLMSFIDSALFMIAQPVLQDDWGVTVSLNGDFLSAAEEGDLIEATGDIVRAGKSLIFVQGRVKVGCRNVLAWSGVIKRVGPRAMVTKV